MYSHDHSPPLLSIVIPCFGRHEMLVTCIGSLDARRRDLIQVVVVDDGSSPPLGDCVRPHFGPKDAIIRLESNRGRATALRAGLLAANGQYSIVMDSDDEFIPGGLDVLINDLLKLNYDSCLGLVYETVDYDTGRPISRLPDALNATLLALRADHGVRGDLKEVISTESIRKALYPDPWPERRVPTSYIWAGVSAQGEVISRNFPLVRHRYLPGGMTKTIKKYKKANPAWLARTHLRVALAPVEAYASKSYRWIAGLKALSVRPSSVSQDDHSALVNSLGPLNYGLAAALAKILGFFR